MLAQLLLRQQLGDEVNLHVDGAYMGYRFCGNFTGDEDAAGQHVTYEGHTAKLKPGRCSPAMMVGYPYMRKKPRDFTTTPDKIKVHWDGKIWCP